MTVLIANNVSSILTAPLTAAATSMTVTDGSRFPVLTPGNYFYATIITPSGIFEIVKVTTRTGNAMSIVRAQDGTNAQEFPANSRVEMRINAASVKEIVSDQNTPLEARLTTAEANIVTLDGRLDTAEANIVTLDGRLDIAEPEIDVLQAFDTTLGTSAGSNSVGFLQAGAGATARTVQGKLRDTVSVKDFGAVGNGSDDDTTKIQAAIDFATINGQQVFAPGGPYLLTSTLNVSCRVIGTLRNRFGTGSTFTSNVGAGVYAINYTGILGSLDSISLTNTGAGNGINVSSVSTQTAMKDVYVTTLYPITTGSGSIGVSFGSDATPGLQAITSVFDNVTSRNYDICFRMRYYSNSNIYRKFYALNTNNAGQPSTAGYLVNGRGAHFDGCLAESNFLYALNEQGGTNGAEENVYTCFWAEGVSGMQLVLGGSGSLMINPYGFVGGTGGSISLPITKSAYASVIKNRGPSFSDNQINQFDSQGVNLIENAAFSTGTGGLNWGGATLSGNTIYGYNSLDIQSATPATSVTVDHLMTYLDLDVYSWLRGKTITMACFGKAETGVNMSLRAVIRTAAGSNIQYATSQSFPVGTPGYRSIAMTIPTDPADGRYIVFRITASGVTSGTPSKAGEIAVPMVYLGNKQNDITPRFLTDGADTTFGNLTFQGGGWNTSHPVLGTYHLWVDTTGDLRIKNGAPATDLDGTIVGTQL